jgi:hypothetical protein
MLPSTLDQKTLIPGVWTERRIMLRFLGYVHPGVGDVREMNQLLAQKQDRLDKAAGED